MSNTVCGWLGIDFVNFSCACQLAKALRTLACRWRSFSRLRRTPTTWRRWRRRGYRSTIWSFHELFNPGVLNCRALWHFVIRRKVQTFQRMYTELRIEFFACRLPRICASEMRLGSVRERLPATVPLLLNQSLFSRGEVLLSSFKNKHTPQPEGLSLWIFVDLCDLQWCCCACDITSEYHAWDPIFRLYDGPSSDACPKACGFGDILRDHNWCKSLEHVLQYAAWSIPLRCRKTTISTARMDIVSSVAELPFEWLGGQPDSRSSQRRPDFGHGIGS